MRINPGLHVLALSASARQYGLGPHALVLHGLQDPDLAFLAALRAGIDDGQETAEASRCSVNPQRAHALTQALSPALLPFPDRAQSGEAAVPALRMERLAGDIDHLCAAYGLNGSAIIRRRARAAVEVSGLGRTGSLLARALAAGGVGTLLLSDPGPVLPTDLGPAFSLSDLGMSRAQAVKRHIYRLDPTIQVLSNPVRGPGLQPAHLDLAIWVGKPPMAARTTGAEVREHPHLTVTLHETGIDVGPLVIPGLTPCLECLERQLADGDTTWYSAADALSRQLVEAAPAGEESTGALAAAGAAAGQALAFLDGVVQPAVWSAVLVLRSADGYLSFKKLSFHPDCGCRLQRKGFPAQAS
ncbi:hypothetical protein ABIB35_003068 [Arthrobacter sp. UYP6]|uniref:ThiF family adenylyltransferase n=1 Tax=Arthrobacter sp. UYP6 TaxID=1756378 RepID=UPI00339A0E27